MKIDPTNFDHLVQLAMAQVATPQIRPVVEKELLHFDILFCLNQAGLLDNLVFQGGTSTSGKLPLLRHRKERTYPSNV